MTWKLQQLLTSSQQKGILRYLKGMIDFGLLYSVSNNYKLVGYSDRDWVGDAND